MTNTESNSETPRVSDYLRGRLTEEETRQFEMRMLEDDELFAQVQCEDLLRQGLVEQLSKTSESKPNTKERNTSGDMTSWVRWLQPALTGALALAVIVLGIGNLDLRQQLDQMQAPLPGIPVITLHDQRALLPGTEVQPNDFGDINGPFLLEIDVSAYEEQEFKVEIQTAHDIYIYERVQPDARGYLTILFPVQVASVTVFDQTQQRILNFLGQREHD